MGTQNATRTLPLQHATAATLADYGVLIAPGAAGDMRTSDFYEQSVQLWTPGRFVSDADTTLSVARVHPRHNEVIWMERHFQHTQCFIPLGGRPFAVVVGAPTTSHAPDPSTVRAFRFDGSAGFMMHIGTWHEFPFALDADVDVLVILRKETNRNLQRRENDEAIGADLEKLNLRLRLGHTFSFLSTTDQTHTGVA